MNKAFVDRLRVVFFEIGFSVVLEAVSFVYRVRRTRRTARRRRPIRRLVATVISEWIRQTVMQMHVQRLRMRAAVERAEVAESVARLQPLLSERQTSFARDRVVHGSATTRSG
jgi:hypothetical protein